MRILTIFVTLMLLITVSCRKATQTAEVPEPQTEQAQAKSLTPGPVFTTEVTGRACNGDKHECAGVCCSGCDYTYTDGCISGCKCTAMGSSTCADGSYCNHTRSTGGGPIQYKGDIITSMNPDGTFAVINRAEIIQFFNKLASEHEMENVSWDGIYITATEFPYLIAEGYNEKTSSYLYAVPVKQKK